jgi:hypothetical protein
MSGPLRRGGNAHSTSHPQPTTTPLSLSLVSLLFLYFFSPVIIVIKIKKEEEEGITCVRVVHVTWKRGLGSREEKKENGRLYGKNPKEE